MRLFRVHFNYIAPFLDYFYIGFELMHNPDIFRRRKKHQKAGIYFLILYFHRFENFYLQIGDKNSFSAKGVEGFSLHISGYVEYRTFQVQPFSVM